MYVCLLLELLYNLTADADKRQKSQPSRVYFTQNGSQISQVSQQLSLDINREQCQRHTAYVKVSLDILVLLLAVFVLNCPCAACVLSWSFPWPWALSPRHVDVWYELFAYVLCCSFLSVYVVFGWSIKVCTVPAKMFREIKRRGELKCPSHVS